ncbi:MAG TPA: hypothetical protein VMM77_12535 [Gemmatimonadaceae bacterium]|nr:hypothetical protein [Gemmatimonadaceae bacterium]
MTGTRTALCAVVLCAAQVPTASAAQSIDPSAEWKTLSTTHFDVHFTPELESVARRGAAQAESSYAALAARLHPPRGRVDLVFADNVDFTNGFATPVPTNRIVVYTTPPVNVRSLRYYDDWMHTIIAHELVHIFHLDRARGIWRAGQYVFGRSPWLMPNLYAPAWITEGLAVYLESSLTTAGRANASHQRMVLHASALAGEFPRLNELSLASSRYPGGDMAYGHGGVFIAHLARTHGDGAIREFVERSSGALIPYRLNHLSRRSFGTSFADAWEKWRDSIRADLGPVDSTPLPQWRRLTNEGFLVAYPRWRSDTSLFFTRSSGRNVPALYGADTAGRVVRLSRRNAVDANVPHPGGGVLFAQLEFLDRYHIRSDLYREHKGETHRLTRNARLTEPDVRSDGWIVAVRGVPGTNQLVLVSPDGGSIRAITAASPDTQWAGPRWAPDGRRIATTRWTRGAYADIVVLDTTGALLARLTNDRALDGAPAWLPSGDGIVFSSDREGAAALYFAEAVEGANGTPGVRRLSAPALGLDYPAVSPDGRSIAATSYREGGWDLGVARLDLSAAPAARQVEDDAPVLPPATPTPVTVPARSYSPWRSLLPRAWLPLLDENAAGDPSFGGAIHGTDVLARHAYNAQVLFDPSEHEHEWSANYRYRGLGQPVLSAAGSQEWGRGRIVDSTGTPIGALHRRARFASLAASLERPRIRTNSFVTFGGELEQRDYMTSPAPLLESLNPFYRSAPEYRSLVASAGFSNAQRPPRSISPENGVAVALRGQADWLRGTSGVESRSLTTVVNGYRALPFRGFAHHVLAARVAVAAAAGRNPSLFEIGGASGSAITLLPGIGFGERRSLGVRGFAPGVMVGSRAMAATLEYRAPLALIHRGVWWLPAFLDRASLSLFGDAGAADGERLAAAIDSERLLVSAGGEFGLNIALQYDVSYFLRVGVAAPVHGRELARANAATAYVRIGAAF